MTHSVRAAVLTAPGRYEVQEFPKPELADGALLMPMVNLEIEAVKIL